MAVVRFHKRQGYGGLSTPEYIQRSFPTLCSVNIYFDKRLLLSQTTGKDSSLLFSRQAFGLVIFDDRMTAINLSARAAADKWYR